MRAASDIPWLWDGPEGPGQARDRASRQRLVAGALELLKTSGLEALSMRKLAAHVGVSLSTVYAWAGSKDRLLAWVVDSFYAGIPVDDIDARASWKDQSRELAIRSHAALKANPAVNQLLFSGVLAGSNTLRVLDRWISILLHAGFDEREAVAAQSLLARVIVLSARHVDPEHAAELWIGSYRLDELPPDEFPGLTKTAQQLHADDGDDRFRFALESVLDGLEVRLSHRD